MLLKVSNLAFNYNGIPVFREISASVRKGTMVSIVGPNGTGKTTLLKCIARFLKPAGGTVLLEDRNICDIPRKELSRRLGYVPQSLPLRFPMTVFETVLTGRRPHMSWSPSENDLQRTAQIIQEMNLDDLAMREMDCLSGGQAQKVMLARALAQEPDYLLLDEPTSSLDMYHQLEVLELVDILVRTKGVGVLMTMHDLNLAVRFSHTILMMQGGEIVCQGMPSEVITSENIRTVYGVEAVVRQESRYLHVQPLHCVKKDDHAQ